MNKVNAKPRQKTISNESKSPQDTTRHGYVGFEDLPYIMAKEKGYTAILPELWKNYQCDLQGPKEPKVTTEQDRVVTWQTLFHHFPHPPFHSVQIVGEPSYIELGMLKRYFTEIIGIPLPTRLFRDREREKIKIGEMLKGEEIIDKYEIKPFQLLYCIKEELTKEFEVYGYKAKLQPYSPIFFQRIHIRSFYIGQVPSMPFNPYNDQEIDHIEDLLPHLSDLIFKRSEVEEALREYGLYQQEETGTVDTAEAEDSPLPDDKATGLEIASSKYAFIKLGKLDLGKTHYDFIFKNQTIRLRGLGADYIYYLMRYYKYPDKIDVVQLLSDLGKPFDQKPSEQRVEKIDKKALAQVIKKLNLGKQGEQKLKDIACDEPELIERYLKESTFRGKIKTFSNEKDKIIDSVRKAMANILSEIRRSNEEAYNHLHTAFKPLKSNPKSYTPTEDIPWKFN